jgi:hypothetical protein
MKPQLKHAQSFNKIEINPFRSEFRFRKRTAGSGRLLFAPPPEWGKLVPTQQVEPESRNWRLDTALSELSFGVCHEKAKCLLGSNARCIFGRLARAMTTNEIFKISNRI